MKVCCYLRNHLLLTPTTPLVASNCCNESTILFIHYVSELVMVPRITAFQTRNRPRGIAVPSTIEVLHHKDEK
ncbi:hypothetical protein L2E82_04899 [Cichorium intybus]|uniref:Uncharacterized protein n=1 Tax=Cichorium intybus TaxID=13427 RepID=A0ACB9H8D1_CICIN|nr:hypothetical protein L2E82_04899 [Cichorium intybus]